MPCLLIPLMVLGLFAFVAMLICLIVLVNSREGRIVLLTLIVIVFCLLLGGAAFLLLNGGHVQIGAVLQPLA